MCELPSTNRENTKLSLIAFSKSVLYSFYHLLIDDSVQLFKMNKAILLRLLESKTAVDFVKLDHSNLEHFSINIVLWKKV